VDASHAYEHNVIFTTINCFKVTLLIRILFISNGTVQCGLYRLCSGYPYCFHLQGKVTTKWPMLFLVLQPKGRWEMLHFLLHGTMFLKRDILPLPHKMFNIFHNKLVNAYIVFSSSYSSQHTFLSIYKPICAIPTVFSPAHICSARLTNLQAQSIFNFSVHKVIFYLTVYSSVCKQYSAFGQCFLPSSAKYLVLLSATLYRTG
jgi:hypothetical protein